LLSSLLVGSNLFALTKKPDIDVSGFLLSAAKKTILNLYLSYKYLLIPATFSYVIGIIIEHYLYEMVLAMSTPMQPCARGNNKS
jgi:hypothetical protein